MRLTDPGWIVPNARVTTPPMPTTNCVVPPTGAKRS
jgi:hypothetical protein